MLHRDQFGELLNRRGLTGEAVEVGTFQGEFALALLECWEGKKLWCVDPYQNDLPDYPAEDPVNDYDLEAVHVEVLNTFARFGDRWELLRMLSVEAAPRFADAAVDFVYIDANHTLPYVTRDIAIWWPKLRPGGILAGHDWSNYWADQVGPAVAEFACREKRAVHVVDGIADSWYVFKPSRTKRRD